jgi:large repetitive protein
MELLFTRSLSNVPFVNAAHPRDNNYMRKPAALLTALAVAAGITVAAPAVSPAAALSPGVHFSADNLPTWQANGVVYALATASNGRVVVGGTFTQLRPPTGGTGTAVNRSALAVLNAETGAPESCALNVAYSGGTPTVRSLVASPDGNTVYVGGNFTSINGVSVTRVAAINPATCAVTSFRAPSVSSTVYAMALSGSRLYLAGAFTSVGGQARQKFAAVSTTSNSTVLPWVANAGLIDRATTVTADGRALTVSPDGTRVVVGGEFDTINGQDSHSIAVVNSATGANVRNYPAPFIHRNSVTKSLYSDGTRFYGGNEGTGGGVFDGRFAINWSTLDQEWRDNCLGATQAVLEHRGTLYAAHHAHDCTSVGAFQDGRRNYFTAQNAAAPARLLQWFPRGNDGIGEGIGPRALTVAAGRTTGKEYLWSGGEFTQINGVGQQGLTRWGPDDTGNPPGTTPAAEALTGGAIQVRFRTVTDTDDSDLRYSVFRNGSTTPIYTTTATSFWWTRPQVTFVDTNVTPGTRYTYRVQVSDGRNTSALSATAAATASGTGSAYASRVTSDGARLYWRYDETSGEWVQDKSARSTTTTANNGLYKFGAVGGAAGAVRNDASTAATFDGVDDFVWEDQLKQAPTTYTMETWIRTDTTTGGKIIGFGTGRPRTDSGVASPSRTYDRHVYMENTGHLAFGVYTGTRVAIRSAQAYNDNQWHHVVATQGPAGMQLYVDGRSVASNSVTTAQDYVGVWHVGGDNLTLWPNNPTSRYFRGQIDETAVYDRPLSASQVADHYALAGASAPTDTQAPSAPGAPSVSADGSTVTVRWSAATDNVGVTGYRVHRGTSADFAVGDANRIGTVTGTSYTDAGRPPGTYHYRIVAVDAAGNASGASSAASATVSDSSTAPVVLTGGLTADALVAENNAAKAYGTVNYLVARGGVGAANISYLAFDVPAAPAGKTLTGATLRVRTTTDSASASGDSFALRLVSGAWSESTVNWTTRPTALGSTVGTLTGARALNTSYDVTLDAAALRALAGSNVTVAMVGSGTDNVRLWSREAAAASRPVLTFTYTS